MAGILGVRSQLQHFMRLMKQAASGKEGKTQQCQRLPAPEGSFCYYTPSVRSNDTTWKRGRMGSAPLSHVWDPAKLLDASSDPVDGADFPVSAVSESRPTPASFPWLSMDPHGAAYILPWGRSIGQSQRFAEADNSVWKVLHYLLCCLEAGLPSCLASELCLALSAHSHIHHPLPHKSLTQNYHNWLSLLFFLFFWKVRWHELTLIMCIMWRLSVLQCAPFTWEVGIILMGGKIKSMGEEDLHLPPILLLLTGLAGSWAKGWLKCTWALRAMRGHVYWWADAHMLCPKMPSISRACAALRRLWQLGPCLLLALILVKVTQDPLFCLLTQHGFPRKCVLGSQTPLPRSAGSQLP